MRLKSVVATAAAGVVVLVGIGSGPSSAAAPTKYYPYCANLLKDYPYGVARNAKAANRAVREGFYRPATSAKARKIYRERKGSLDRDNDGTACEQTAG